MSEFFLAVTKAFRDQIKRNGLEYTECQTMKQSLCNLFPGEIDERHMFFFELYVEYFPSFSDHNRKSFANLLHWCKLPPVKVPDDVAEYLTSYFGSSDTSCCKCLLWGCCMFGCEVDRDFFDASARGLIKRGFDKVVIAQALHAMKTETLDMPEMAIAEIIKLPQHEAREQLFENLCTMLADVDEFNQVGIEIGKKLKECTDRIEEMANEKRLARPISSKKARTENNA